MLEYFGRWPLWYWLLVGYTAALSIGAMRRNARRERAPVRPEPSSNDDRERARRQGERVGRIVGSASWLVGALLLLPGWNWARAVVAIAYARSASRGFHDFAVGFAEGRKSASLAAAPEYVRGRVPPQATDYVAAALQVGVARGIPLVAVLYAIVRLPGQDVAWRSVGLSLLYLGGAVVLLVISFVVWASVDTGPRSEVIASIDDVRALVRRLVDRGANSATVVFRVRGREHLTLRFTKHLSGAQSGRVFKTYSPASELRVISTLVVARRNAGKFQALLDHLQVGGRRPTGRSDWRGRHILRLDHGRNVDGATALAIAVFARVFDADIGRDATATSQLILDEDAPHLTGVAPAGPSPSTTATQPPAESM